MNVDFAIKTVALEFKWEPAILGGLFLDNIDINGLYYWYELIKEIHPPKK